MSIDEARRADGPTVPGAGAHPAISATGRWSTATRVGVLVTVGVVLVANLVWIARDHQAPAWDQALYLHLVFQWRSAFHQRGVGSAVSAIYHTNPSYPPLYMLVITPFEAIGQGVDASLVANTLMLCGVVIATAVIAAHLYGQRAAFPAAVFVSTCTIIYGLSRTTLVDILLVLLAALAVMSIVLSDGFERRGWAVVAGVLVGLAALTKMTGPGILLAPVLASLALPVRVAPRRQAANLILAGVVALLVALPWYVVNLSPALAYLRSATGGQLAIGTTATH
jgi:4-amino-4-deoxy-L-arabinose transferase-like glycosyltransferase